ncbi:methionyl-tRNA formyltransferase [Geothrix sp. PMB-07]|uniref:methionyl-tRNA formyltransferase n=1 Tax=Geothrix sp. PMB-07 TaxID=3068640 RepID=UPI002741E083|nr:methionyl-tRNA formyltransferase [Geothrix sp. PMB-07]WLT31795.1 methionyl-tRNA formyltransferase [Geothrix sp. PMB-07]
MRIAFFGASELGRRCCAHILDQGLGEIVGIFTLPAAFNISYSSKPVVNVLHADFHGLAAQHGIPVVEAAHGMRECQPHLTHMAPDLIICIGWYHMIPKSMRDLAPLGCIGIHASLLPKYRGGAPLVWAMIQGERETGVSLFHFGEGVDNGDLILQKSFEIGEGDTIKEVLKSAEAASLDLLSEALPRIKEGTALRIVQREEEAFRMPQRSPEDGLIDWTWDSRRIRNFIRAQTRPYPGAFTFIEGRKVILWDAEVVP